MNVLGWLIVIFLVWVFGRHATITGSLSLGNQNSVPTSSDNLPIMSDQNTRNTPANQPPTWSNGNDSGCSRVRSSTAYANPQTPNPVVNAMPVSPVRIQRSQAVN